MSAKLLKKVYAGVTIVVTGCIWAAALWSVGPMSIKDRNAGNSGDAASLVASTQSVDAVGMTVRAIDLASSTIHISSRVIGAEEVVDALRRASNRGVRIRILLARPADGSTEEVYRNLRQQLTTNNVTVFFYAHTVFASFLSVDSQVVLVYHAPIDGRILANSDVALQLVESPRLARQYAELWDSIARQSTHAYGPR